MVVMCRTGSHQSAVHGYQGIRQVLFFSHCEQLGKPGLILRVGHIDILYLDGLAVPYLQVKLCDPRGLRRRPRWPSATGGATLPQLVAEHQYLGLGRHFAIHVASYALLSHCRFHTIAQASWTTSMPCSWQ